jgi:hypothetical protein
MHNGSRSSTDTDHFSQSMDTEVLASGRTCSSGSSDGEDRETNMCLPRNEDEPVTLSPSMAKISSHSFGGSERPTSGAFDHQHNSLYDISAELSKKRDQLVAAQNRVSKLLIEIRLLEVSAEGESQQSQIMSFADTLRPRKSHKRGHEEVLHSAKRATTVMNRLPPTINTTGGRPQHSFTQGAKETPSDYAVMPTISISKTLKSCFAATEQNPGQPSVHKVQDTYLPFALQTEKSTTVRSLSIQTPWSDHSGSTNRLSSDSGHASLDIGLFNCRASSIDNLEEQIAWVA